MIMSFDEAFIMHTNFDQASFFFFFFSFRIWVQDGWLGWLAGNIHYNSNNIHQHMLHLVETISNTTILLSDQHMHTFQSSCLFLWRGNFAFSLYLL